MTGQQADGGPGQRTETSVPHASGARLRLARQARGFSQQQLAGMAGVSRQAVSAVEAGLSDPSLRVALALSRALGLTVEELFGPAFPEPVVPVRPLAPLGPAGARVSLAPVGDSFVALPLSGGTVTRAGFVPAGGRVTSAGEVTPLGPPRPTLVVAGCDPALPLIELPLSLLDPPVSFVWWPCPSQEALTLAADGLVHVAGAHLRGRSGDYNTGPARELLRGGGEVIGFCSWREGLVLRPDLAGRIADVADVAAAGLRLVNREPGAEARRVLDRELARHGIDGRPAARLPDAGDRAPGGCGGDRGRPGRRRDRQRAGRAGLRPGFRAADGRAVRPGRPCRAGRARGRSRRLFRALSSQWLLDQLASLPGYSLSQCGERVATIAAGLTGDCAGPAGPGL